MSSERASIQHTTRILNALNEQAGENVQQLNA